MSKWFYKSSDALAKVHREAYERSLLSTHPIKVRAGVYYYKGYEINYNEERAKGYKWGYVLVSNYPEDWEFARTKSECVSDIDGIIAYELSKVTGNNNI